MSEPLPLPAAALFRAAEDELPACATSADLAPPADVVGQARAIEALRFGLGMAHPGHNIFVLGEPDCGQRAAVEALLRREAGRRPVPSDWCYVHNFAEPERPLALCLPAGRGAQLRRDMQGFVAQLGAAISNALESDEFRARAEAIQQETKDREDAALQTLGQDAAADGVALLRGPRGFAFVPTSKGEPMDGEQLDALPAAERTRLTQVIEAHGARLHKLMRELPRWRSEMQARLGLATREAITLAVGHLIEDLKERYSDLLNVLHFFDSVLQDVIDSGEALRSGEAPPDSDGLGAGSLKRYQVNLLVDHAGRHSAPIVFEDNPNFQNLVGRLDQMAHMGTLVSNFTLIRAGALHRANGGYLMLDAAKVLAQPYAWEGLKRALKSGSTRIESLGQAFGWAGSPPLEPEAIRLDLKVVLFGEHRLYYLLKEYDPEFDALFKVAADFAVRFERSDDNVAQYARTLAALAVERGLLPLTRAALACLVEHGARLAEDAFSLSARLLPLENLMLAADALARSAGAQRIERAEVELALVQQHRRGDRLRGELLSEMLRDTVSIATTGTQVGQVNALAVLDLGDQRFAHPVRVTASVRLGEGEVMDIERESELGGALHSKGVLILSAYLGARYGRSLPPAFAASLVFEQSYGPVEGDSASLAELCALLSALADVPIRQSLAITGSLDQLGRAQAIGGVNEKIEGFFDLCNARGLTGEQGVVIPAANVAHLMLRADVVAAAAAGRFHVWPVRDADQAIALLTGLPAGPAVAADQPPVDSIDDRVQRQLQQFAAVREAHGDHGGRHDKDD